MNWLRKVPSSVRSASGLEWVLWRKLPWIAAVGSALPLLCLLALHALQDRGADSEPARWLQVADYIVAAVVLFHWTMVITVAIGCVIVMIMKGPGYAADSYRVSHSDRPRAHQETDEEAAGYRHVEQAANGNPSSDPNHG
ncbi:MAG: hypothetical protein ACR2I0_15050 [Rhodoferax sp.]